LSRRPCLLLLLHAHLPFVRHPEQETSLEERWLFEAITECYLPLLGAFERLADDDVAFRLTLSLSPPLIAMLRDPLLQVRYLRHLEDLIELAERECQRHRKDSAPHELAVFYRRRLLETRRCYQDRYRRDPLNGFLALADSGRLELITTAATHGYLPLLRQEPAAVRAQLRVGADYFRAQCGRPAQGIWLPECGYFPGLESELRQLGFRYFFLESHGIDHASPRPAHGVRRPIACPNRLAAFGRDPGCSAEVWSGDIGYPGHPAYREFHRDIGGEREAEYLGPLGPVGGNPVPTGLKYHRVTDRRSAHKAWYDPAAAHDQARCHALDFVQRRLNEAARNPLRDRPPLFVAPYDAELLGHWWFEGPDWLEQVIRRADAGGDLDLIAASDYLERYPLLPEAQPSPSSWGEGGFNRQWLNEQTAWLYPHLHRAAADMVSLAAQFAGAEPDAPPGRALRQAGRSLLLAQSSDWPFILRTGTTVQYAAGRVRDYLSRFYYLKQALLDDAIDARRLAALEQMDTIFPNLDCGAFMPRDAG